MSKFKVRYLTNNFTQTVTIEADHFKLEGDWVVFIKDFGMVCAYHSPLSVSKEEEEDGQLPSED